MERNTTDPEVCEDHYIKCTPKYQKLLGTLHINVGDLAQTQLGIMPRTNGYTTSDVKSLASFELLYKYNLKTKGRQLGRQ